MTCTLHIGMNNNGLEVVFIHFTCPLCQADIAEAVKGVVRLIFFVFLSADVRNLSLCGAQIVGVEITVGIKNLGVVNLDFVAVIAFWCKFNVTGNFLPKVNNRFTLGSGDYFFCVKNFNFPYNFALLLNENIAGLRKKSYFLPMSFISYSAVNNFTVINLAEKNFRH